MKEAKFRLTRSVEDEPIALRLKEAPDFNVGGVITEDGRALSAAYRDGELHFVGTFGAGEHTVSMIEEPVMPRYDMEIEAADERIRFHIGGDMFAEYVYSDKFYKPYFGPVMTSFGESYTRLDFEATEHPHHRSVFFGVGDVSLEGGAQHVDFWNEPANCGIQKHKSASVSAGGGQMRVNAETVWTSHDGEPMADAESSFTVYSQPHKTRTVDVTLAFTASYGKLTFGATKEAGPLGVRVADPLRVERGGYMKNSYGAVGEEECWGRAANYCIYGGELSGHPVGIAVFDSAENERFPTTWHIRNYGLFAANNLYFRGGLEIPAGGRLEYKYRIIFFEGDENTAKISDRYVTYAK
ncbi:MAG: PmoA family protein [Firmicutes bacterium]|nr:PmoA family protein [Bacillota bacterium]